MTSHKFGHFYGSVENDANDKVTNTWKRRRGAIVWDITKLGNEQFKLIVARTHFHMSPTWKMVVCETSKNKSPNYCLLHFLHSPFLPSFPLCHLMHVSQNASSFLRNHYNVCLRHAHHQVPSTLDINRFAPTKKYFFIIKLQE